MNTHNDGGPAFAFANDRGTVCSGMTLRDYFAAQSLNGILMNYTTEKFGISESSIASHAYKLADAMLAARNAHKTP